MATTTPTAAHGVRPGRPRPGGARGTVVAACLAVVLARLVFLTQPLRADEAGYLMVARQWHAGGEFLYGDLHVDRPPLLLLLFRVAALSEWDGAVRVLAIPFAVTTVLACAQAGRMVGGAVGARWSAVVAAALVSSPALAADQADGELFAATLVALALALFLTARQRPVRPGGPPSLPVTARGAALAGAAGLAAGSAPLVKQNFLDGLVFVALLLGVDAWRRRGLAGSLVPAAGVLAGAALPQLVVYGWATAAGLDAVRFWTDLVRFRAAALDVILADSLAAVGTRAVLLVLLALVSGLVPLLLAWVLLLRRTRPGPVAWALTGTLAYGLASVAMGGSYWLHYLLQLVPALAVATGLGIARAAPAATAGLRGSAWWSAAAALLAVVATAVTYALVPAAWYPQRIGEWLAESGRPGDTAVVLYGSPSVLEAADLGTPYPYLWSLPMRTLDPEQERLRATLAGPTAPTWVVVLNPLGAWGLDEEGRLRTLLAERYDRTATVCGRAVWLRRDLAGRPDREPAPVPEC